MSGRKLFTPLFWLDAAERSIATALEVPLAVLGVVGTGELLDLVGLKVQEIQFDPYSLVMAGLIGAGLSLAKSVYAAAKADTDTASLVVDTKPLNRN